MNRTIRNFLSRFGRQRVGIETTVPATLEVAQAAREISRAFVSLSAGYVELYVATGGDEAAGELATLALEAAHLWEGRSNRVISRLAATQVRDASE